jgi:hypothetical protein
MGGTLRAFQIVGLMVGACVAADCGSEVCEAAYDKMTECISGLNCAGLDPLKYESCQSVKRKWSGLDKTTFVLGCRQNSAEAEKIVDCQLDPLCVCPP